MKKFRYTVRYDELKDWEKAAQAAELDELAAKARAKRAAEAARRTQPYEREVVHAVVAKHGVLRFVRRKVQL
jgi:hypothetical protein